MRPAVVLVLVLLACGSDPETAPAGGVGGHGGVGGSGGASEGGSSSGGGAAPVQLDVLLMALRADRDGTMLAQSRSSGWPAPVEEGHLVVSTEASLTLVAGDHDHWQGTAMIADDGFHWLVIAAAPGHRYKLSDGQTFSADPWSRGYEHDEFGVMSMLPPGGAHLERHFQVGDDAMQPRTVRVYLPAEPATHLLYMHDGQNLFDPAAAWGGWALAASVPAAMSIVAIDNTAARFDEYTHVTDDLGSGPIGGHGDAYADFLQLTVRPLIDDIYGEPGSVGVMGSSLGGLISLHIGQRHRGDFDFVASMSGTMGWGSIGANVHNETIIERYAASGMQPVALYLDSGGSGSCVDSDLDGIEDDAPDGADNYCENKQLEATLLAAGWQSNVNLWHWWEQDAPHNEAAWAARSWRPLQIFAGL